MADFVFLGEDGRLIHADCGLEVWCGGSGGVDGDRWSIPFMVRLGELDALQDSITLSRRPEGGWDVVWATVHPSPP